MIKRYMKSRKLQIDLIFFLTNVGPNLAKQITLPKNGASIFYYLGKELDKSIFLLSSLDNQDIV